jgi:hypothetical protein
MKAAIILAAILLAMPALAPAETLVARRPTSSIRLTEKPCGDAVKSLLREEVHDAFKTAIVVVHGKEYVGCWIRHDEARFYIHMENGESFMSPTRAFKVDQGV